MNPLRLVLGIFLAIGAVMLVTGGFWAQHIFIS
jgi:hypothetical protein